jgi:hypothetical protein
MASRGCLARAPRTRSGDGADRGGSGVFADRRRYATIALAREQVIDRAAERLFARLPSLSTASLAATPHSATRSRAGPRLRSRRCIQRRDSWGRRNFCQPELALGDRPYLVSFRPPSVGMNGVPTHFSSGSTVSSADARRPLASMAAVTAVSRAARMTRMIADQGADRATHSTHRSRPRQRAARPARVSPSTREGSKRSRPRAGRGPPERCLRGPRALAQPRVSIPHGSRTRDGRRAHCKLARRGPAARRCTVAPWR